MYCNMDRQVSTEKLKKEKYIRIAKIVAALSAIVLIIVFINSGLSASLSKGQLTAGKVDIGDLNITVNASGKVIPFSEEIIVAPINSRILEVYKHAGDSVNVDEPLLKLELSSIETEYNQKLDEREMKKRKLVQTHITLSSNISELEMQERIQEMQLQKMATELQNEKYLDSIGASTADKIREIALNYNVSKLEHQQLKQKIENEKDKASAEIKVQELEYSMFEKGLSESARLLSNARILSPQKATVTYINNQIGAQVAVGTQVAIISDLSKYKIEAEIANSYASKLRAGAKAIVRAGQEELKGVVVNIVPSVKNGTISFSVVLNDGQSNKLRSGLSVDIFVEYGIRDTVLRIPNGSYYSSPAEYDLWVVKNGEAEKRRVLLGESNYDFVEVKSGLEIGEEVILNNMENYKSKQTIKIK